MLGGESVDVLTAGSVANPYGGNVVDWDSATEVTVPNVLVEPRPSGEPAQDARNAVTSGFTLYFTGPLPVGLVLTSAQRIRVRGVEYDVIGDPADWRLGSWEPGLVVQVEKISG